MGTSIPSSILVRALKATNSPVTIADVRLPDAPIVWCNEAFLKLTQYSEDEVLGRNCRFLQGKGTKKSDVYPLKKAVNEGTSVRVLIKNYTKSGSPFWNDLLMSPIKSKKGEVTHFVGFQNDVSSDIVAKNAEKKIKKLTKIYDVISHEKRQLEDLNAAKDDFISVASHQLRTPATVTKQYLSLVMDGFAGDISKAQESLLQRAFDGNERQIELIDRLLDLARLESGKITPTFRPMNVVEIANKAMDEHTGNAQLANQTISIVQDSVGPVMAIGDFTMTQTILDNLIDNSLKYSYENSHTSIDISSTNVEVKIAVKDTGIGMDKTSIDKAFERFARIENRELQEIGGAGVGLYWAKKATELQGGTITAFSELGKGSTFTITLPRYDADIIIR